MTSTTFELLSEGGQLLLWGARHWMVATRRAHDVPASVLRPFEAVGGSTLFALLTAMLLLAARDGDRPLSIHPPCCAALSDDEDRLVRCLAALTSDETDAACVQLRAMLGRQPSTALQRYARALAVRFGAAGLDVGFADMSPARAWPLAAAAWDLETR